MKKREVKPKSDKQTQQPFYKTLTIWLSGIVVFILIATMIAGNMFPKTATLTLGDVADKDYRATRNVVDKITTEQLRQETANKVPTVYYEDKATTEHVLNTLDAFISAATQARVLGLSEYTQWMEEQVRLEQSAPPLAPVDDNTGSGSPAEPTSEPDPASTSEPAAYMPSDRLLAECNELLPISMTDADIITLLMADEDSLNELWSQIQEDVSTEMQSGIKEENLQSSLDRIERSLLDEDKALRSMGMSLVFSILDVNFLPDMDATLEAQKKAAEAVPDVVYKEKQNIVRAGEVITEAQLAMLMELGLADQDRSDIPWRVGGLMALVACVLGILWIYMLLFEKEVMASLRLILIINLMLALTLVVCWFTRQFNVYFIPGVLAAMMVAILVGYRSGMVVNFIVSVFVGFLAGANNNGTISSAAFVVMISTFTAGTAAIFIVNKSPQRSTVLLAGLIAGGIQALMLVAYDLLLNIKALTMLKDAGIGMAGGFLSAMATLGLLPVFELIFKVVTPMKLMELSNPNHPLLKKLMLEAPGTYHHSIMVGNLAESAADAIGANSLLVRTGAYYHDVGKIKRPFFFKENQIGTANPHDQIEPALSAKIIRSHTNDGYELAKSYRIPSAILDIIQQHHGDSKVSYFYYKALKAAGEGETVSEEDYRYSGPAPTTREAAIVMIADTVEAAVRSLPEKTSEKIDELVISLIRQKLEDGQFNNCAITLNELEVLGVSFKNSLAGVYHERIPYTNI